MKKTINTDIIIDYILENKLTKEKFCNLCNMETTTFEKILSENVDIITIEALYNIAKFFGLSNIKDLFIKK